MGVGPFLNVDESLALCLGQNKLTEAPWRGT